MSGGSRLDLTGTATFPGPLTVVSGGSRLELTGTASFAGPLTVIGNGSQAVLARLVVPDVSVLEQGLLTTFASTTTQMYKLDLEVSGTLLVDSTSKIDVSGKGYLAGRTTGNTTVGGATGDAGGSYGGLGASSGGVSNRVYGDYADPATGAAVVDRVQPVQEAVWCESQRLHFSWMGASVRVAMAPGGAPVVVQAAVSVWWLGRWLAPGTSALMGPTEAAADGSRSTPGISALLIRAGSRRSAVRAARNRVSKRHGRHTRHVTN